MTYSVTHSPLGDNFASTREKADSLSMRRTAALLCAVLLPAACSAVARGVSRRSAIHLASATPLAPLASADAWCGEPFPPFAYSLPWYELDVGDGVSRPKLPVRIVGDLAVETKRRLRPLLVLPSPGLSYEYLENLEALSVSE